MHISAVNVGLKVRANIDSFFQLRIYFQNCETIVLLTDSLMTGWA